MKTLVPPPALPQKRPLDSLKKALLGPSSQFRAARRVLGYVNACPVCRRLDSARDRTLQLLLILLEESGQQAAFEKGYGLCLKHFARALSFDPLSKVRTTLIEVEAAKLGRLQWALQETLRQRAWHARPEAKDGKENIPQQAIRRFSGSIDWS